MKRFKMIAALAAPLLCLAGLAACSSSSGFQEGEYFAISVVANGQTVAGADLERMQEETGEADWVMTFQDGKATMEGEDEVATYTIDGDTLSMTQGDLDFTCDIKSDTLTCHAPDGVNDVEEIIFKHK
jgi:tricorn protease-like protein